MSLQKSTGFRLSIWLATLVVAGTLGIYFLMGQSKPLGHGPPIVFPNKEVSQLEIQQFLDGDFQIFKDVKALPPPVVHAFTEEGGSRLVMANPGERFLAGDLIYDSSLPRKQLIFAAVSGDKCVVHYKQGGIGLTFIVATFRLKSPSVMEPLWLVHCGPAKDLRDLQSQVAKGECPHPVRSRKK